MSKTCYIPLGGIDDVIAKELGWYYTNDKGDRVPDAYRVANLRAMYESTRKPLDLDNLGKTTADLKGYAGDLAKLNVRRINSAASNLARSYDRLRETFSLQDRNDRVTMIASYFSAVLDDYQKRHPNIPRSALIQGFYDKNGVFVGGQAAIFEEVYSRLMNNRAKYYRGSQDRLMSDEKKPIYAKKFEAISKVLDPEVYAALVSRARFILRDTEGIILGQKLEYASTASLENYKEDDLDEVWEMSESKREGWQEHSDETSALGSVGQQVRKLLSTIPQVELNEEEIDFLSDKEFHSTHVVKDDLGCTRYIDPAKAHSQLIELLRGVQNEEHMMKLLTNKNGDPKQVWLTPVIEQLRSNPQLRTQFFVDFKKNFQPYSIFYEDKVESKKRGATFWKTKVINRLQNLLGGTYMYRISFGKGLGETSIFNESSVTKPGTVNWENMGKLSDMVYEWTHETATSNILAPSNAKLLQRGPNAPTKADKIRFLSDVFKAMGIEAGASTVEQIVTSNAIYQVHKALSDYFDVSGKGTGISLVLTGPNVAAWKAKDYGAMSEVAMKTLYRTKQKSDDKLPKLQEHTEKLLNIVTKFQEGQRLESRSRFGDKTLFSNIAPSYLGDKLEAIKAYAQSNDKEGLRRYILAEYCNNSFFAERDANGNVTHIYSPWVQALLDCCDTPAKVRLEDTFAGKFDFERDLGNTDQAFEDFTSRTHCIDMLIHYFADNQQNRSFQIVTQVDGRNFVTRQSSALYPVFILGDSGVSKYIRAPRIQEDKGQWGEKSKDKIIDSLYEVYKQEKRRMEIMRAMNEKLAKDGYKEVRTTNEFSTLVFLNEEEYKLPDNPQEGDVKAAIRRYMNAATQKYIKQLGAMGITELQTTKDGKPTGKLAHLNQIGTPQNINSALEDFYWNTKLATIQQLQMMTIDPSFYKDTKDLQKRYKEVHAPGSKLSLMARNPFKEGNPLFNPVDEQGRPQPERCVYFDDIELSVENTDFGKAIMSNPKTRKAIENYRRSSLTDGQGYRTLDSYRKVLGMAGKWTQEMENVYDEIMTLREKYQKRVPKEDDSDYEDYMSRLASIANKAVVFQPIKPYMFTHESYTINNGTATTAADRMLIPVQHKYAEAVLIPELLPEGSKVRDMAYWMDEHVGENGKPEPIDLMCATTVVKVGNFGSTKISGTTSLEEFTAALNKGYVHQLNYEDYRIQTNVPEHINSSQLFGTQVRKLIMSHLDMTGTKAYNYLKNLRKSPKTVNLGGRWKNVDAQNLSGRNLLALYNSLIVANIVDSYQEFASNVGDINKLADALMQSVLSNSRESMDNLLSYAITGDEKFLMPLFEGGLEHDSAAMLLSIFKKKVNKQSIKGGSAVQVSAFGINGYKEDGDLQYVVDPNNPNNILYAECEIPFDLSFTDSKTKTEVHLDYDTYCNTDGTLKVGKYLDESDPEYSKYISYKDNEDRVYKPKIEMEFPDILSLVAYRIPTERDYSMINLRVKRFSRKTAGGTIKVPVQGTTIAGFDFDVDKLYFMRREFRRHTVNSQYDEKNFSKEDRYDIFAEIYEQHPEILDALNRERDKVDPEGKTPLHTYWNSAKIGERFGISKNELFESTAKYLEIEPETIVDNAGEEYFEDYDFDKTPEQNTRAARNNLLIDLIQARLSDPETFAERYTPGGFFNASKAARKLRELLYGELDGIEGNDVMGELDRRANDKTLADPEPNYDPTDPMTIVTYNQQNQVAGKLIGIFANQNTNHAFASLMNKFLVKDSSIIEFAGHKYNVDGVGKDLLHAPHRADGQNDVDLYMAELLAASVDAVKDPVLNFLNLNIYTADAGAILIRLGYTTEEVGLLLNQPVIKQLCETCSNEGLNITQVMNALGNKLSSSVGDEIPTDLSKESLAKNIVEDRKARERGETDYVETHAAEQLAVLELFKKIQEVASDVSLFVTNTKFTASNAVGSTFGEMYAQQLKVQDYVDRFNAESLVVEMQVVEGNPTMDAVEEPITSRADLLDMSREDYMDALRMNPFAYEQAMFDMNRKAIRLLAPNDKRKKAYYPYGRDMYVAARATLRNLSEYSLDGETIDTIHRDLLVYLLANQENSDFCGEVEHKKTGMSNRFYYEKQFVKDMFAVLESNPQLKELAIFKYLRPEEIVDEKGNTTGYNLMVQDIGGIDPVAKEMIKESWASMVDTDEEGRYINPEAAELARDLFMWNFYKLGFDFSPLSFMNLAPTAVKEAIKVPRKYSIPVNYFSKTKPEGNDVFVFYPGNAEHSNTAWDEYLFENGVTEGLIGEAYALPIVNEDGDFDAEAFKRFCRVAASNPDKVFKVQTVIDQHEIDAMAAAKIDIPSNVQFTEESVISNDWSTVNYGVNRSYQELLNEILDGTNESIDSIEFAKQFLLNHLDNWRFVLNTAPEHLRTFINQKVKPFNFGAKESITIDVSGETKEVSGAFAKVVWGQEGIISATWKPVIKIEDYYYMADGEYGFNVNKSLKMNYRLVSPYGSKGKSLMYKSDVTVDENLDRDTTQPPSQSPAPEAPRGGSQRAIDRAKLESIITTNMMAALAGSLNDDGTAVSEADKRTTVQNWMASQGLSTMSDTELSQFVDQLRSEARANGMTFLDEKGNPEQCC